MSKRLSFVLSQSVYTLLFAVLIVQIALPFPVHADPPETSSQPSGAEPVDPKDPLYGKAFAEIANHPLFRAVLEADGPESRLPDKLLPRLKRNIANLADQSLVQRHLEDSEVSSARRLFRNLGNRFRFRPHRHTSQRQLRQWNLSATDVSRPEIYVSPAHISANLRIQIPHDGVGISLGVDGYAYWHTLKLNNRKVIDHIIDRDYVILLLEDSAGKITLEAMNVATIKSELFNGVIPCYHIANVKTEGKDRMTQFGKIKGLRFIRRRYISRDQSERAQEGNLQRIDSEQSRLLFVANQSMVDTWREHRKEIEPLPVHPKYVDLSFPDLPELESIRLKGGDIAIVTEDDQSNEFMAAKVGRDLLGLEMTKDRRLLEGAMTVVSSDFGKLVQGVRTLTPEGQAVFSQITSGMQVSESQLGLMRQLRPEGMIRGAMHQDEAVEEANRIAHGGDRVHPVDEFTFRSWVEDAGAFDAFIDQAQERVNGAVMPSAIRRFGSGLASLSRRARDLFRSTIINPIHSIATGIREHRRKLAGLAAAGMGLVALDAVANDGHGWQLASDFLAACWDRLNNITLPILSNPPPDGLTYQWLAVGTLTSVIAIHYFLFWLGKPFYQKPVWHQLINTGSWLLSWLVLSPQRALAMATRQQPAFRAWREHGVGAGFLPIFNGKARDEAIEKLNWKIDNYKRRKSVAAFAALLSISAKYEVDPIEFLASCLEGGKKVAGLTAEERLENGKRMAVLMQLALESVEPGELQEILKPGSDVAGVYLDAYDELKKHYEHMKKNGVSRLQAMRANYKHCALPAARKWLADFGDQTHRILRKSDQDPATARFTWMSYVIDYGTMFLQMGFVPGSKHSDPTDPDNLLGQKDAAFWSHYMGTYTAAEQTYFHWVLVNGRSFLTLALSQKEPLNEGYAPVEQTEVFTASDHPSMYRRMLDFGSGVTNLYNASLAEKIAKTAYWRFVLIIPVLIGSFLPRIPLSETFMEAASAGDTDAMVHALNMMLHGTIRGISVGAFPIIYLWLLLHSGYAEYHLKYGKMNSDLRSASTQLAHAIEFDDEEAAEKAMERLRKIASDQRNPLGRELPATPQAMYDDLSANALVPPEEPSTGVEFLSTLIVAIITTVIATHITYESFNKQVTWTDYSLDLSQLQPFTGIPTEQGGLACLGLMGAWIYILLGVEYGAKAFWDWFQLRRAKKRNDQDAIKKYTARLASTAAKWDWVNPISIIRRSAQRVIGMGVATVQNCVNWLRPTPSVDEYLEGR